MKFPVQRVWARFQRTLNDGSVKKFRVQDVPPIMYGEAWHFIKEYFVKDEPFSISNVQRVWRQFERTLKDGSVKKFRVQDVPPNMYGEAWQFIKEYFIPDEPFSIISGMYQDPVAMEQNKNFWTKFVLPQNVSLLCVEDIEHHSEPEIIGLNNLRICEEGKDKGPKGCELPEKIERMFKALYGDFNVYKHFGVKKYMGGVGIAVNSKYRGLNIGLEILLAREPLCKHHGIKLTETIFTAKQSQVLADKAGFTTVFEKTYEELGKQLNIKIPEQFKVCKVMVKSYD